MTTTTTKKGFPQELLTEALCVNCADGERPTAHHALACAVAQSAIELEVALDTLNETSPRDARLAYLLSGIVRRLEAAQAFSALLAHEERGEPAPRPEYQPCAASAPSGRGGAANG